jgi:hypothetical protein
MTRRRSTFIARPHSLVVDWIDISLFLAGALLVSIILAAVLLSVIAGYAR